MRSISSRDRFVKRFFSDESGATAIEYTLMAAGIAMAIISAVFALGSTLETKYTGFGAAFD